jgi:hypothetical protein
VAGYGFVTALVVLTVVTIWFLSSRWAAERGWVYNRHNPRPRGGGTLGLLEEIYNPSIRHVIEERSSERARGNQDERATSESRRSGGRRRGVSAVPRPACRNVIWSFLAAL